MEFEALRELGLSEKEIKVYVAGIKLGLANVSSYADKANLPRTTTHDLLKSLKEKGIAGYVIKSGVRYFNVVSPNELLEKLREKEKKLTEILPDLEKLQKIAIEKPEVEFYHGIEGFKTVANDLLREKNSIIYAYVAEKNLQYLPIFHLQFRRKRKERKIRVKMLTEKSEVTKDLKKKDKEELREIRFLDKVMKKSDTSFFIYGDKIAHILATEKEQLGIISKNKAIADFHRRTFDLLWYQVRCRS